MTVAELVLVLMRYDGNLPVYSANFHEEYGKVTEETVNFFPDFHNNTTNKQIPALVIVGNL